MTKEELMRKAIELSKENVENGGGPFGAVIATKDGVIIATGVNRVTTSCDPTAHAEVSAIRAAAAGAPSDLIPYFPILLTALYHNAHRIYKTGQLAPIHLCSSHKPIKIAKQCLTNKRSSSIL